MNRVPGVACFAMMVGLAAHPAGQSLREPVFEVASVKPSIPDPVGLRVPAPVTGRFTSFNARLRDLVSIAYGVFDFQVDGGPDWQTSRRFDIQATTKEPLFGIEAMRPMLKALLADRFKLTVHSETREMPIYALVVTGGDQPGAKMTPPATDCPKAAEDLAMGRAGRGALAALLQAGRGSPCAILPVPPPLLPAAVAGSMTVRSNAGSMADLARFLMPHTGRPVQDRTGLNGLYDWEMTFHVEGGGRIALAARPDIIITPPPPPPGTPRPPSVMVALEEQLGLKLESTRGLVEIVVIDSAALPEPD